MVQKLSFTANSITLGTGNSRVVLGADSGSLTVKDKDANTSTVTPGTGIAGFSGVTTYANSSVFPFSPISSAGSLAYATATSTLYLSNGSGWYKITTINTAPSISLSATTATPTLDALTLDFTYTVTEPEGTPTSVSVANSGIATTGNVAITHTTSNNHVRLVFDGTTDYTGDATVTLTVTDGVNTGTGTITITTNYIRLVDDSEKTVLLMRGVGDSTTKNANFDDVSDTNNTITSSGTPYQGTFTPYNSAGYSRYFDGTGDYLTVPGSSDFNLLAPSGTSNNFTIEMWLYKTVNTGGSDYDGLLYWDVNNRLKFQASNSIINFEIDGTEVTIVNGTHNFMNNWSHLAIVREGTSIKTYVNGVLQTTHTNSSVVGTTDNLIIGENGSNVNYGGFITDLRIVKGTAVHTANFTPPSEPLTAVSGTKLLLGAKSIMRDSSSDNRTITINGNVESRAFSPYKHATYSGDTYGGSVFMDGTDYLTTSGTANTNTTGGQAWTVEYWVYPTAFDSGGNTMFDFRANGSGNGITAEFTNTGNMYMNAGGSSYISNQDYDIIVNNWYHMAFVHTGSVLKFYLNGVEKYSNSHTSGANDNTSGVFGIGYKTDGTKNFKGFISDFRFVAGKAVYTGAFTPPSAPLTKTGGTYPSSTNVSNPTASETKYLANFTNGDIIDLSGTSNFGFSSGSNAQSDTGNQKYSVPSVLFDGTGDVINIEAKGEPFLFPGDFTIECWAYVVSGSFSLQNSKYRTFFYIGISSQFQFAIDTSGNPLLWDNGSAIVTSSTALTGNSWQHITVTRSGDQVVLFLDGVEKARATHSSEMGGYDNLARIGAYSGNSGSLNGAISDLRITKGLSRYPFIPKKETMTTSTSFQNGVTVTASNTKLLCCHHSTITTDGSSNQTITANGTTAPAVSNFAPIGGMKSAYFVGGTGNTSSLTTGTTADFAFGTGDATIELWAYFTSVADVPFFVDFTNSTDTSYIAAAQYNGVIRVYHFGNSPAYYDGNTTIVANKWYHIALVRKSQTWSLFINGSKDGGFSWSDSQDYGNTTLTIGGRRGNTSNDYKFKGYLSNYRVVKGQAIYDRDFTVSSEALTG